MTNERTSAPDRRAVLRGALADAGLTLAGSAADQESTDGVTASWRDRADDGRVTDRERTHGLRPLPPSG